MISWKRTSASLCFHWESVATFTEAQRLGKRLGINYWLQKCFFVYKIADCLCACLSIASLLPFCHHLHHDSIPSLEEFIRTTTSLYLQQVCSEFPCVHKLLQNKNKEKTSNCCSVSQLVDFQGPKWLLLQCSGQLHGVFGDTAWELPSLTPLCTCKPQETWPGHLTICWPLHIAKGVQALSSNTLSPNVGNF